MGAHWLGVRVGIGVIALVLSGGIARAEWNPMPIAVPLMNADAANSPGSPYPSRIEVHAPAGPFQVGRPKYIILHAVTHPCPEDLAVLLVHRDEKYLLMSNAGGCHPLRATDIVFSVGAVGPLPDEDATTVPYGTRIIIAASNYGTQPQFPAPAPAGPYTNDMPFFGPTADGTWDLYVMDAHGGNRGVIAGGWSFEYPLDFTALSETTFASIPSMGPATTYPIPVDLTPVAADARVRFLQLGLRIVHSFSDDLRIVLQSPSGTAVVVMANAGGNDTLNGHDLIFDDTAPTHVPDDTGPVEFGSTTFYQPGSEYPGPTPSLPAPAAPAPYATAFTAFNNEPVSGIWKLWVFDDTAPNAGSIGTVVLRIITDLPGSPAVTITSPTSAPTFTSTEPFVHIRAHVTNVERPFAAIWRNQLGDGSIYAAGSMQIVAADAASATADIEADVPVKKGHNKLLIEVTPNSGPTSAGDDIDVTVNEFTYSLPEGSTGVFWDEDVTLFSADDVAAPVRLDFLAESGPPPVTHLDSVPANAPLQLRVNGLVPPGAVSTIVHSTDAVPLAVERTMSWDSRGYGGSGGTAISPDTTWLFAEGSQGYFDTFLLLANDNDADAHATVRFLLEGGGSVDRAVTIAAHKRVTIYAADVPELTNRNFGMAVNADIGITAERAMYFPHGQGRIFEGGHDSAGVNAARTRWILAEGATGPFFECFILISNPSMTEAHVRLKYLLPSGEPQRHDVVVPPLGRVTVNVERDGPALANAAVSTVLTSDVGIIVERSMYWPDISIGWREAHNSPAVGDTALRWGVSDIRVGGPRDYQTFILLANPGDFPAEVQVRLMTPGAALLTQTYTLPPTSRTNVVPSDFGAGVTAGTYSAEVQVLNYQGIVVEKAMYWNAGDEIWAAGTGVVATVLPPR
jgi:subtilisin-like proprotein convertase family protein